MRMLRAELLKIRRRWASYIVLLLLISFMALVYVLVGFSIHRGGGTSTAILEFPSTYAVIDQFAFGLLGSLLAVAYAGAIAGADWNWGVFRLVVARGESRGGYIVAKFAAIAIALFIGVLIVFLAGIALTFVAGALAGVDVGDPLSSVGGNDLFRSIYLGYPVLLERAAIGFAVAVLMRSQVAGIVVGIVLYIGEGILGLLLTAITVVNSIDGQPTATGVQWFQFLPFSIGNEVLAHASRLPGEDLASNLQTAVGLETAIIAVAIYLVLAVGVAVLSVERSQISS